MKPSLIDVEITNAKTCIATCRLCGQAATVAIANERPHAIPDARSAAFSQVLRGCLKPGRVHVNAGPIPATTTITAKLGDGREVQCWSCDRGVLTAAGDAARCTHLQVYDPDLLTQAAAVEWLQHLGYWRVTEVAHGSVTTTQP